MRPDILFNRDIFSTIISFTDDESALLFRATLRKENAPAIFYPYTLRTKRFDLAYFDRLRSKHMIAALVSLTHGGPIPEQVTDIASYNFTSYKRPAEHVRKITVRGGECPVLHRNVTHLEMLGGFPRIVFAKDHESSVHTLKIAQFNPRCAKIPSSVKHLELGGDFHLTAGVIPEGVARLDLRGWNSEHPFQSGSIPSTVRHLLINSHQLDSRHTPPSVTKVSCIPSPNTREIFLAPTVTELELLTPREGPTGKPRTPLINQIPATVVDLIVSERISVQMRFVPVCSALKRVRFMTTQSREKSLVPSSVQVYVPSMPTKEKRRRSGSTHACPSRPSKTRKL